MEYERVVLELEKTWPGVEELCSNFTALQSCLNDSVASRCTNEYGFTQTGFSVGKYSRGFASDYHVLEFTCGRGYAGE